MVGKAKDATAEDAMEEDAMEEELSRRYGERLEYVVTIALIYAEEEGGCEGGSERGKIFIWLHGRVGVSTKI